MPRHSQFSNFFKTTVTKTAQRYVATIPKPIGETHEILGGSFIYNPATRELHFAVDRIYQPIICNLEKKIKKGTKSFVCWYCEYKCVDKNFYKRHLLDKHKIDIKALLAEI